ncbi:MAG: hypothetical protein PHU14_15035, partial [Methylovulum sp.]|nr:hypothetical protein [Methylovulum sp.]
GLLQAIEQFLDVTPWGGYSTLHDKIHASPAYAVPEAVIAYFRWQLQPQYQFLHAYFSADFLQAI